MFSLDPHSYDLADQYRQDRIRDVEQHELVRLAKQHNPSLSKWRQTIASIGTVMITLGNSMQVKPIEAEPINTISRPVS